MSKALEVSLRQAIEKFMIIDDEFVKHDITKQADWLDGLDIDTEYSREIGKHVYCGNDVVEAFLRCRRNV